jgi:hypothetical protein
VDLFLNANHKEGTVNIRGNIVHIQRGQLGWSEVTMANRWKWSRNKVRRYIARLVAEGQVIQQKDRYITTILTIVNYENYQTDEDIKPEVIQQKDSRRNSRRYINKNEKNEKKIFIQSKADALQEKVLNGDQWKELICSFEPINPMYEDFFKNKTERRALEDMTKKWGYEKLLNTIRHLPEVVGRPYAPRITKPSDLRRDIGKLIAFVKQEQLTKKSGKIIEIP